MVSVNKSAITPKKISLPENGKTTKPASLKSDAKISKAIVSQSTSTAGSELDFLQSFNSKLGNTKTSESTTKNIKAETTTTGEWNQEEAENLLKTGGSSSNPFAKGNMKPGFTGDDTAQSVLSRLNQKNGIDPTKSSTDSSTQNTQSDNFTKSMGVKQGNSTGVDFSKASTSEINDYLDNIQDGDLIDYDDAVSILGNGKLTKTELTKMKDQLETAYKSSGEEKYNNLAKEVDKRLEKLDSSDWDDALDAIKNSSNNDDTTTPTGGDQAQQGGGSGGGSEGSGGGGSPEGAGGSGSPEGSQGTEGSDGQQDVDGSNFDDGDVDGANSTDIDGDGIDNLDNLDMNQLQNMADQLGKQLNAANNGEGGDIASQAKEAAEKIPSEATHDRAYADGLKDAAIQNDANAAQKESAAGVKDQQAADNKTEAEKAGELAKDAGKGAEDANKDAKELTDALGKANKDVGEKTQAVGTQENNVRTAEEANNSAKGELASAEQKLSSIKPTKEDGSTNPEYTTAKEARDAAQTKATQAEEALGNAKIALGKAKEALQAAEENRQKITDELKNKIAQGKEFAAGEKEWKGIQKALNDTAIAQGNEANGLRTSAGADRAAAKNNINGIKKVASKYNTK